MTLKLKRVSKKLDYIYIYLYIYTHILITLTLCGVTTQKSGGLCSHDRTICGCMFSHGHVPRVLFAGIHGIFFFQINVIILIYKGTRPMANYKSKHQPSSERSQRQKTEKLHGTQAGNHIPATNWETQSRQNTTVTINEHHP